MGRPRKIPIEQSDGGSRLKIRIAVADAFRAEALRTGMPHSDLLARMMETYRGVSAPKTTSSPPPRFDPPPSPPTPPVPLERPPAPPVPMTPVVAPTPPTPLPVPPKAIDPLAVLWSAEADARDLPVALDAADLAALHEVHRTAGVFGDADTLCRYWIGQYMDATRREPVTPCDMAVKLGRFVSLRPEGS